MATIAANLDRMVSKGTITAEDKATTITIITYTDIKDGVVGADLVVEAATENVELKLSIFKQLNDACCTTQFQQQTLLHFNNTNRAVVSHPSVS
jgi:3-hydroxybutyryl-CoA dehydrogenase